jgi:hypothetical protein
MPDIRRTGPGERPARRARATIASVLIALALPPAAASEENRAAGRIEAMARFLAKTQSLHVAVDCSFDVVQDSGQKIEFGERREMVLRRPDRVRIDVTRRDGSRRGLVFDGTQLTAFDLDEKVYATVPRPGTVDAALAYFTQDLNMRLPLRDLFATDLPQQLKDVLDTARLVGEEKIGGAATDHIAFRGDTADVQVWIPRDGDPLPQRIVISYRQAEGQPQFEADFSGWNLKPEAPESLFTFTAAAGAEQIPILVPGRGKPAGEKRP